MRRHYAVREVIIHQGDVANTSRSLGEFVGDDRQSRVISTNGAIELDFRTQSVPTLPGVTEVSVPE